jgi:hypothetical protein
MDNIDAIAKTDERFPTAESRTFCVVDGFGFYPNYMIDVFKVSETIAKVFEATEPIKFFSLFGNKVRSVNCFKVPPLCQIRQELNRQVISRDGVDLFKVSYFRDYDRMEFDLRLIGELKTLLVLNEFQWNGLHGNNSRYRFSLSDPWVVYDERWQQFPEALKVAFRENLVRVLKDRCFSEPIQA